MIDTIVLLLSQDEFKINKIIASKTNKKLGIIWKQNPTKKDLKRGDYKPRLTLASRISWHNKNKRETTLKIELSLPKLLFGNNFEELQYKDRFAVIEKLVAALKEMGVTTTQNAIANASVAAIHYSKNIPLIDGATPYHFINKIRNANIPLSLDVNQTDYRNHGHCYKWHCNSYEVVFYDKIKDLEKARISGKRALERDNEIQIDLFRRAENGRKKFEVLRMEVRLNKRQKIKQLFKKLNIKADLVFKKLFKPAISKKVLLHYLDKLESRWPTLIDYKTHNDKALLAELIFANPTLGPKKILQMYGLKRAIDAIPIGEMRAMFSKYSARSWYRLIADANSIQLPKVDRPLAVVRSSLTKLKPLKFKKSKSNKSKLHTIET